MSLLLLIIAFVMTGLTMISTKLIVQVGLGNYAIAFVMMCTASAAISAGLAWAVTKPRIEKRDIWMGLVMGASGALAMMTLVLALRHLPGVIVFPVRSSASIALTAAVSCAIMHERLGPRQWVGVALAVAAVYLLV